MSASQSNAAESAAQTSEKASGEATPTATSPEPGQERRTGLKDRRVAPLDRRNEDRVADEIDPRRNPDIPDRRRD